jgi:hypothetical protein
MYLHEHTWSHYNVTSGETGRMQQQYVIIFLWRKVKNNLTFPIIQFGDDALLKTEVYEWCTPFKDSNTQCSICSMPEILVKTLQQIIVSIHTAESIIHEHLHCWTVRQGPRDAGFTSYKMWNCLCHWKQQFEGYQSTDSNPLLVANEWSISGHHGKEKVSVPSRN